MQDLDIRGAGNLLGAEQSGFIADIGFETYQKIMREAVAELRAEGLDVAGLSDREQELARAALGRAGKVLDMPHEKALFIGAGRDKAPDCMNDRINRTRHCSPARPAGHP